MLQKRGQISAELMVTISAMLILFMAMYFADQTIESAWNGQKELMLASTASNQMALAINRVAAGGNGTQIVFNNYVGGSVANVTINYADGSVANVSIRPRAVRATTLKGMWATTPIITNNTNVTGAIPINQDVVVKNTNGVITIEAS